MDEKLNSKDVVEFKYSVSDNTNYIKDVYYETETENAVKFTEQTSEKYFWIPKSMIKGGWKKKLKIRQNIKIKFQLELVWKAYD